VKSIVAHANSAAWQKKTAETIVARYYGPGHTSGDIVISFETSNVVHMGDLMFNRFHPYIDRPAGASIGNWIKTLETASLPGFDDCASPAPPRISLATVLATAYDEPSAK
jgi:glyoxylase-like metal-dependent hydrolase (beta-lactamase superfamily II)